MSAPACVTLTAEQWSQLLEIIALLPVVVLIVNALLRDFDRYEYRVRRFLRRRRIRAIRARRLAA